LVSPSSSRSYLKNDNTISTKKMNSLKNKNHKDGCAKSGISFTVIYGYAIAE
jgi:hypothetical protein